MHTFLKNGSDLFEPNPNKLISGLESVAVSVWPEAYLAKLISDHFRSIDRGHDPKDNNKKLLFGTQNGRRKVGHFGMIG